MTPSWVVDSCVAIKWFVREPDSGAALQLLATEVDFVAPDLILVEVANALWKNARLGRFDGKLLEQALLDAPRNFAYLAPSAELLVEASALARDLDHPVYDCLYVVLARRTGARVVTTDARLLAKLAGTLDAARVVALAEFA